MQANLASINVWLKTKKFSKKPNKKESIIMKTIIIINSKETKTPQNIINLIKANDKENQVKFTPLFRCLLILEKGMTPESIIEIPPTQKIIIDDKLTVFFITLSLEEINQLQSIQKWQKIKNYTIENNQIIIIDESNQIVNLEL